ncbi:MAG: hypothetical protein IPP32_16365 [Bacteroidetes bacterium]|nr:hypothetical protein [Bacteroidota bacterium]
MQSTHCKTLNGYSPLGGTWSGVGVSSAGVFTPSVTGNFILTYTYTDGNSCSSSDTMIVKVVNPQIANAGNGFSTCLNSPAKTLIGFTPSGGTWTGAGITGNIFTPLTAGVGTFTLTYTFGSGTCLSSDTIRVIVNPLPTVTVNSATICAGQTATLTANGATTYSWSNGGTNNPHPVTPLSTSNFTVTGTNTLTGCTNTAVSIVTVNPLPIVNAGPSITLCNQPIANTLNGYSPLGGTWSGVGVSSAGVFTPSVTGILSLLIHTQMVIAAAVLIP